MMESLRSQLLVAVPNLGDPNFHRSVVLMIQHDEDGALGVVLNHRSTMTLADVWEQISDEPCDSEELINLGGPVQGLVLALHSSEDCADNEVLPGVYLAMQPESINKIVQRQEHPFRIFVGYSGWGEGQLEDELAAGGWLTAPAKPEHLFHDDEDLWKTVAESIGHNALFKSLSIAQMPDDPSLN